MRNKESMNNTSLNDSHIYGPQLEQSLLSQNTLIKVPQMTLGIGIVLGVFVAACTIMYFLVPASYQQALLFFAAACAAAGQLAAAFYAARVLEFTSRSNLEVFQTSSRLRDEERLRAQKICAQSFATRWNDATMFHARRHCQALIDEKGGQDHVISLIKSTPDNTTNVKHVLNFLEELAISIDSELCSDDVAKKFFGGIVVKIWHAVDFYVRQHRIDRARPLIWAGLESLYDRWK